MNHRQNKIAALLAAATLAFASLVASGCLTEAEAPTEGTEGEATASKAEAITGSNIQKGQTLAAGSSVKSSDGRLSLLMQADGNLVLYFSPFGTWNTPVWASNTTGHGGAWAIMQDDGNFVVYDAGGAPLWATATGPKGSVFSVQSDGNLVVYDAGGAPLWSSNTAPQVPPASKCLNQPQHNAYFCPAGSWWDTCEAPTYNPYAAFTDGESDIVVKCKPKCGDDCIVAGKVKNDICQGNSMNIKSCWNNNGTLVCTPGNGC